MTETEQTALRALAREYKVRLPSRPLTVGEVVRVVAVVGGYEPTRSTPPGWIVLLRGWKRFQDYVRGFLAGQQARKKPKTRKKPGSG